MVLPLLLLLRGKHFIQDRLENHGILGVLFFRMPSSNRGHSEKQYSHSAMVFKQGGILSSGLELCCAALRQFWRPLDSIFSRVPRKKVEFWPRISRGIVFATLRDFGRTGGRSIIKIERACFFILATTLDFT